MKVLVACEESQAVCKAFREKGHEAYQKKNMTNFAKRTELIGLFGESLSKGSVFRNKQ